MDAKTRRNSILRKHASNDNTPDRITRIKARVSFHGKKSVREFCTEQETNNWNNSYEESENSIVTESVASSKRGLESQPEPSASNKENVGNVVKQEQAPTLSFMSHTIDFINCEHQVSFDINQTVETTLHKSEFARSCAKNSKEANGMPSTYKIIPLKSDIEKTYAKEHNQEHGNAQMEVTDNCHSLKTDEDIDMFLEDTLTASHHVKIPIKGIRNMNTDLIPSMSKLSEVASDNEECIDMLLSPDNILNKGTTHRNKPKSLRELYDDIEQGRIDVSSSNNQSSLQRTNKKAADLQLDAYRMLDETAFLSCEFSHEVKLENVNVTIYEETAMEMSVCAENDCTTTKEHCEIDNGNKGEKPHRRSLFSSDDMEQTLWDKISESVLEQQGEQAQHDHKLNSIEQQSNEEEDSLLKRLAEIRKGGLQPVRPSCSEPLSMETDFSPNRKSNNLRLMQDTHSMHENTPHRSFIEFEKLERETCMSGIEIMNDGGDLDVNNRKRASKFNEHILAAAEKDNVMEISCFSPEINTGKRQPNNFPAPTKRYTLLFPDCNVDETLATTSTLKTIDEIKRNWENVVTEGDSSIHGARPDTEELPQARNFCAAHFYNCENDCAKAGAQQQPQNPMLIHNSPKKDKTYADPLISCDNKTIIPSNERTLGNRGTLHFHGNFYDLPLRVGDDIEKTRISLVDTLLDDDDDTTAAAVKINPKANIGNGMVVGLSGATLKKNSSINSVCHKCKRCNSKEVNNDSPQLPNLSKLRQIDFNHLLMLRKQPTFTELNTHFQRSAKKLLVKNLLSLKDEREDNITDSELSSTIEKRLHHSGNRSKGGHDNKAKIPDEPFIKRMAKYFKKSPNWIFDFQLQYTRRLVLYHKKIRTFALELLFEQKEAFASDVNITHVNIHPGRMAKKAWKSIDHLLDFQLKLELPSRDLNALCKIDNCSVLKILEKVDETCFETLQLAYSLWKITFNNKAKLCGKNNRVYIHKVMYLDDPTKRDHGGLEEVDFQITVTNIRKLSFRDITAPAMNEFLEDIQFLPTGLEFLKVFLPNPLNYLKIASC